MNLKLSKSMRSQQNEVAGHVQNVRISHELDIDPCAWLAHDQNDVILLAACEASSCHDFLIMHSEHVYIFRSKHINKARIVFVSPCRMLSPPELGCTRSAQAGLEAKHDIDNCRSRSLPAAATVRRDLARLAERLVQEGSSCCLMS